MRIEAYTQVQQIYNKNNVKKNQPIAKAKSKDVVQFSSLGRELQAAKQAVAETPDMREELMAPVRKAMTNGTYEVSAESFADKLLAKYNEMR